MSDGPGSVTACCADLYGHPLAGALMGPSFHPGGLALTQRLAERAGLREGWHVLDAGSGLGTSAVYLAKRFRCRVTGVTLERQGVDAGRRLAEAEGVAALVTFVQADVTDADLPPQHFDVVLMECVLSAIPDKRAALVRLRDTLRPGGALALSDVTRAGDLPASLRGLETAALCVEGAVSLAAYAQVLEDAGFEVEALGDEDRVVSDFLRRVRGGLLAAQVAVGLGKVHVDPRVLVSVREGIAVAERLASAKEIGYCAGVARRA